jgi:hypothetical protein
MNIGKIKHRPSGEKLHATNTSPQQVVVQDEQHVERQSFRELGKPMFLRPRLKADSKGDKRMLQVILQVMHPKILHISKVK